MFDFRDYILEDPLTYFFSIVAKSVWFLDNKNSFAEYLANSNDLHNMLDFIYTRSVPREYEIKMTRLCENDFFNYCNDKFSISSSTHFVKKSEKQVFDLILKNLYTENGTLATLDRRFIENLVNSFLN